MAQYQRLAKAGSYLTLSSSGFDANVVSFTLYAGGVVYTSNVRASDAQLATIQLPADLPAGVAVLWPRNLAGYGVPILLNRPELWWGEEQVVAGHTARVMGRNLTPGDVVGEGIAHLYGQLDNGPVQPLATGHCTPEWLEYTPPAGTGALRLWSHQASGGDAGWSEPLVVQLVDPQLHPRTRDRGTPTVLAAPAAGTDIVPAMSQAANNLFTNNGGGIVQLPAGTFDWATPIGHFDGVLFVGAVNPDGTPATRLVMRADFAKSDLGGWYGVNYAVLSMAGARNIIFDNEAMVDSGGGSLMMWRYATDFVFDNCQIICPGQEPFRFSDQARRIYMDGFSLTGLRGLFEATSQVVLTNYKVRYTHDSDEAFILLNCTGFFSDKADVADFGTGVNQTGAGRIFHLEGSAGSSIYLLLSRTTGTLLGVVYGVGDPNRGEQFLGEGNGAAFVSLATGSTSRTVQLAQVPPASVTTGVVPFLTSVVITSGLGLSQHALVVAHDGQGLLTLDRPWLVPPDSTSQVACGPMARYIVVVDSVITAKPGLANYSEQNTNASTGIAAYGNCHGWVARRNSFTDVRYPLAESAVQEDNQPTLLASCHFNEFTDNDLIRPRFGYYAQAAGDFQRTYGFPYAGLVGSLVQRNQVTEPVVAAAGDELPRTASNLSLYTDGPVRGRVIANRTATPVPLNYYCTKYSAATFPVQAAPAGAVLTQTLATT